METSHKKIPSMKTKRQTRAEVAEWLLDVSTDCKVAFSWKDIDTVPFWLLKNKGSLQSLYMACGITAYRPYMETVIDGQLHKAYGELQSCGRFSEVAAGTKTMNIPDLPALTTRTMQQQLMSVGQAVVVAALDVHPVAQVIEISCSECPHSFPDIGVDYAMEILRVATSSQATKTGNDTGRPIEAVA